MMQRKDYAHSRPLKIGLSAALNHPDPERPLFKGKRLVYAEESMFHWVMSAGAIPFLMPTQAPRGVSIANLVTEIDALILTGGADVAPGAYGESPLRPEWSGDSGRDAEERALIDAAIAQGKPILGICRGLQILNVALGGSLFQDIETLKPGASRHRDWGVYDENRHGIKIEPGSGLARLYPGISEACTNSVHHQAINVVAPGLTVEAKSTDDGIIEAVRGKITGRSDAWIFAVQWHPEWHDSRFPELLPGQPILDEFLGAAQTARQTKKS